MGSNPTDTKAQNTNTLHFLDQRRIKTASFGCLRYLTLLCFPLLYLSVRMDVSHCCCLVIYSLDGCDIPAKQYDISLNLCVASLAHFEANARQTNACHIMVKTSKKARANKALPSIWSGILPEWSKGADLRSARHSSLRGFKPHRYQSTKHKHASFS